MWCCLWPLIFLGCCGNDGRRRRCRRREDHRRPIDFPPMNIYSGIDRKDCHKKGHGRCCR